MVLRRSVLRLFLASLALPLLGAPGWSAGVGLGFDLTLVSTRAEVQPLVGASATPATLVDPAPLGLLGLSGVPDIGMALGETGAATFRRESDTDWALSLPRRDFRNAMSFAAPADPATGLARFTLYDAARLIVLDFPRGRASITESVELVLPFDVDGRETLLRSVTYDFAISNVMDATGLGGVSSVAAFSSLGPDMMPRGRVAGSHAEVAATAGPGPSIVPLPAALLFAVTAIGAVAGLRRTARG